jgi:hypothetical protein
MKNKTKLKPLHRGFTHKFEVNFTSQDLINDSHSDLCGWSDQEQQDHHDGDGD